MKIILSAIICMILMMSCIFAQETEMELDDIAAYSGSIPPSHSLYNLKLMFENIDEALSINKISRLEKKLEHAQLRLAEIKFELSKNRTIASDKAMFEYVIETSGVESRMEKISDIELSSMQQTRFFNLQVLAEQQQLVLNKMSEDNLDNKMLMNAVTNMERIQNQFEQKSGNKIKGTIKNGGN